MFDSPLALITVLLAVSVFVVTLARRLGLPTILGYVAVGLAMGPHAAGVFPESETTHLLAELGVVFLLFTLGLEFSWPRMVALRREVFGLGSLQVLSAPAKQIESAVSSALPSSWHSSLCLGLPCGAYDGFPDQSESRVVWDWRHHATLAVRVGLSDTSGVW